MNIVLIGYRGSGKSSVGKRLAEGLWRTFVDLDVHIVETAGKTIREIFDAEGEQGFRDRETQAILDVTARDELVIAAGGGAVLRPENVAALKRGGKVIWLRAEAEVLFARTSGDAATAAMRPNLTTAGGIEEVRALLAQREEAYRAAADAVLEVDRLSVEDAVWHLTRMV